MSRLMTTDEIGDVLWRNPLVYARVQAHKLLVSTGQWSQIYTAPGAGDIDLGQLPIPPSGYAFNDERFGNVIIFPGADGKLYFNTDVTEAQAAAVNLPPYTSPSGNTVTQVLSDIGGLINTAVTDIFWIGLVVLGFLVYRELK